MGFLGVPLGWIMNQIYMLIKNYGLSLILFILLTRIVMFPLAIKQQKTTAKTARLQPKMKAIKDKYGKDKVKYQEEIMKLQEKEGVNPAAGCLPMIVQMVLLFGIIDVIYNPLKHLLRFAPETINKAEKIFGTAKASGIQIKIINAIQGGSDKYNAVFDSKALSAIKDFDMTFLGINLGDVPTWSFSLVIIIPILSGITAFLASVLSMRQQAKYGQVMQGSMKYMMYFMPLISLWFAFTLPAGVGLYWAVANIFTIMQTLILGKIYTPEKLSHENEKEVEKNREKMKKRRHKMENYNKMMQEKGLSPATTTDEGEKTADLTANMKEKELAKFKLAEARKRMAEKYGEDYNEE